MPKILVVDDELSMREMLKILLKKEGYEVVTASDGEKASQLFKKDHYDLIIADIRMPKMDGLTLLHRIKEHHPHIPVIMITAYASPDDAILAMKEGAYDYITKPFKVEEIKSVIKGALEGRPFVDKALEKQKRPQDGFEDLVGKSPAMLRIYDIIQRVAPTNTNILISGESGTGKELVAKAIWKNSPRRDKPFVTINCSAIPENLLESELFGHEKGAFTGAISQKMGKFELAHQGTIFLDEVGDMSPSTQAKVLRVLEQKEIERIGSKRPIIVDVRIIAATNKDLEQEVISKRFREDLFYRLNVIHIYIPPLRERRGDIPLLVEHFLKKCSRKLGKDVRGISSYALRTLIDYDFPGNVRELENMIERGVALETSNIVLPESLVLSHYKREGKIPKPPSIPPQGIDLEEQVSKFEKDLIFKALDMARGSRMKAAQLLNISFRSLRYKLKKYGIS
ncbi:MAG TPA: sigma-54-dependent Fis family transcriptional regulator [Syntrophaceae bacterium]|nr:sigma-54-dependent Fis family transcriptional regulator [Syntrophaceae bacterium]